MCEATFTLTQLLFSGLAAGVICGSLGALFALMIRGGSDRPRVIVEHSDLSAHAEALPPAVLDRLARRA